MAKLNSGSVQTGNVNISRAHRQAGVAMCVAARLMSSVSSVNTVHTSNNKRSWGQK